MGFKKPFDKISYFLLKEWLFFASLAGLILSSLFLQRFPLYERKDFEIIFLLFVQFSLIKGLENAGLFEIISSFLHGRKYLVLKLLLASLLLSPLITNDLALLILCPLALTLKISHPELFFTLLAIAANAGSALTPLGNPQNLFIYWFFRVNLGDFIKEIFPLSLVSSLFILLITCFAFGKEKSPCKVNLSTIKFNKYKIIFHLILFLIGLGLIFKIFPLKIGFILIFFNLLSEKSNIKVDFFLLGTFFFFFGFTDNLRELFRFHSFHPHYIFLSAVILSQFMSNVPAALFLSDFTSNWAALLWGVNVGGFGNLIGSLANIIAYRFYLQKFNRHKRFILVFHILNYFFLVLGIMLYYLLKG